MAPFQKTGGRYKGTRNSPGASDAPGDRFAANLMSYPNSSEGSLLKYGYIASMKAQPGHRDDVVAILVSGADGLRQSGCLSYIVSVSPTDDDTIWVTEAWESKERHRASLELPETKAAIAQTMPMLTGEFTSQELEVVGGLGAEAP